MFKLGKLSKYSEYIPCAGEVVLREDLDRNEIHTLIGDGKTPTKDLPKFLPYDIHERVSRLEEEVRNLKNKVNHE